MTQKANTVECPACHDQVTLTSHGRLRQHAIGPYRRRGQSLSASLEPSGGSSPCEGGGLCQAEAQRLVESGSIRERTRAQRTRQLEIAAWAHVVKVEWDEVDRGFIVVRIDHDYAERLGVYTHLSVAPDGTVASYDTNQPRHYPTFAALTNRQKEHV